jgi:gamma-glutamylcyclotransferase (GGCT)/AIG2-like uncharacterized protein YtfP
MYQAGGTLVIKHTTDPIFKFYDLGGFPGAQLGGTIAIQGELWSVPEEGIIRVLDHYEGHNEEWPEEGLFRRHVQVDEDGTQYTMYLYNGNMGNTQQNHTGVWPMKKE